MTQEQHIAQLAVKHITDMLTEAEHEELTQWLEAAPENRQLFEKYTHPDYIGREYKDRIDRKERLEGRIGEIFTLTSSETINTVDSVSPETQSDHNESSRPVHRVHFLKTSWFRYAAAIVVLLGGAGAYLWLSDKTDQAVATTNGNKQLQADIAPGGDRAILTLADGTTIVLDSAGNGNLAQQGSTKIIKLDNGQLAYNTGKGSGSEILYNRISTPRGGQYQVILPDGSKVWLNAASSIKFPTAFMGNARNVEMSGEVYMEIARNVKQSFAVTVNGTKIEVLGTSFNVNAYSDENALKTTLIEGSVRIMTAGEATILKPGQQYSVTDGRTSVITGVNIDQILAWKNGMFQFKGADIQEVMRQLSRWYDVEVVYEGEAPATRFEGEMQRGLPLSSALRILELSKVHFRVEGKKIIITP